MDGATDCHPSSILCVPIRSSQDQTIGVIQLFNKLDDTPFNMADEKILEVGRTIQPSDWTVP